jgi:21S rRNA (GM2251-2'-O)-methyltransferase
MERAPSRRDFWEKGDDRYGEPRTYTVAPRRTIQKVNQDSEWIYGSSVVEAALKADQRTLYRLYVYAGENRKTQSKDRDLLFKNLARKRGVDVQEVTDVGMLESVCLPFPHYLLAY